MFLIVLKYFLFILFACPSILAANTTLKLISVVFRHGDRTPVPPFELYPKDPYKKYRYNPPGYGRLTNSGQLRAHNLGKFLRNTYDEFLETNYTSGFVEARSTNINRTIESVKFALKGLYPQATISVITNPIYKDFLFFPHLCSRYNIEYIKAKLSADVKEELVRLKKFRKKLKQWTGKLIRTARDMYFIYTTLECQKFMNLTLPPWTTGVYPNGDLLNGTVLEIKLLNYNNKMKRQNGGMLLRKFIDDMKSVKNGSMNKNRKIMLYSAHDINVAAVLKALNVYYPHLPVFSAAVIVELHLIELQFFVKVLYYLGVPAEVKELQIPGCKILCPLDQFINLTKNVVPTSSNSCIKNGDISNEESNAEEIISKRKLLQESYFIDNF